MKGCQGLPYILKWLPSYFPWQIVECIVCLFVCVRVHERVCLHACVWEGESEGQGTETAIIMAARTGLGNRGKKRGEKIVSGIVQVWQ